MKDLRPVHMEQMLSKVIASVASCQIKKISTVHVSLYWSRCNAVIRKEESLEKVMILPPQ